MCVFLHAGQFFSALHEFKVAFEGSDVLIVSQGLGLGLVRGGTMSVKVLPKTEKHTLVCVRSVQS